MERKIQRFRKFAIVISGALLSSFLGMPSTVMAQLVTGLAGASGSTVGPGNALYVTEGAAGRISRIDPRTGVVTPFAEGLPRSIIGIGGAVDVAFVEDTAYALVTLVGPDTALVGAPAGTDDVGIYRIDGPDSFTVIANIGEFSRNNPPVGFDYLFPTGVQYALETYRGGFLVTDGHHNRVLRVTLDGEITEFKTFGNVVPTGLEVHGNTVLMAELGPVPHYPEDGKVMAIDSRSGTVAEVASGARMLVDVELGRGGELFALSQGIWDGAFPGSPASELTGSIVKVNRHGTLSVLATAVDMPTSFEIIGNTAYVVSLKGNVWVYPNIARPPYGDGHRDRLGHDDR
jgi:hypothetical protein